MAGNYYTPFSFRTSEELLDEVKTLADKHKRSINKEIEYVLELYVEKEKEELEGKDESPVE